MNAEKNTLYLKNVLGLFKGREINHFYNHVPAHVSANFVYWIKEYNSHSP